MSDPAKLDHQYVWHPFTQMRDWLKHPPIVIASGKGAVLTDIRGRKYLDANSSIWTNLHGHNHPKINAALSKQLRQIAHSSALGLANIPASLLAQQLIQTATPKFKNPRASNSNNPQLAKVFFSDDGSTAMEVALKLAYVYAQRTGRSKSPKFLSLQGAYHGDTVGAVGLGHIDLFHKAYSGLLFKSDHVMAPYCYRCPFNRAKPERADAREHRKCNWECVSQVEKKFTAQKKRRNPYAAFIFEPLMQGAAGMIPQPPGWLRQVAQIARAHRAQLIADEVMTAFGRTGFPAEVPEPDAISTHNTVVKRQSSAPPLLGERVGVRGPAIPANPTRPLQSPQAPLFGCHHEDVQPDFLALSKGMTGGYLPMAATLTTQSVFDAFLGDYSEFKTFFHGHSFTGNQLGAAAALASLEILRNPASINTHRNLQRALQSELAKLWSLPAVGDIRQVGLVAGIELVKDWRSREPFPLSQRAGIHVCEAMARRGVLTRPIGNVIVLMPPYCATPPQVARIVHVLGESIRETLGN